MSTRATRRRTTGNARPARSRLRDAQARLQMDILIEVAETRLAEKGVDGTKMEEIARDAGLSLATIYELCGGKSGLVDRVHEVRLRELIDAMQAAARDVDDPFEALMSGVRAAVEQFALHPSYLRINLREGHAWGLRTVQPSLPPAVEESWYRTIDWMVPIFEEGIRRGVFHPDPPELMARRANAHVQVQMASWLENEDRSSIDEVFADLREQMRRSFCLPPRPSQQ